MTTITSVPLTVYTHKILVSLLYWGLFLGMIFSVYRVSNVLEHYINWAGQIASESLRNEMFGLRGSLSKFIVDNRGKICRFNLFLAYLAHFAVCLLLFILAESFS